MDGRVWAVPVPSELGWETSEGGSWEAAGLGGGRKTGPWGHRSTVSPPWLVHRGGLRAGGDRVGV